MLIRSLTATDTALYQPLRLRALREHPEAFASAFEEEQQLSLETVAKRLQQSSAERYVLGAFEREELNGLLHLRRWEGLKIQHRASIGGMYVAARIPRPGDWQSVFAGRYNPRPYSEWSRRAYSGGDGRQRAGTRPVSCCGVHLSGERSALSEDWRAIF